MGRAFEYRKAAKEKRWANMSRVFPKLAKLITMAAKEGGGDPAMNPKLRTAILNAKAQNMPKDNIDAAIKRANGKDSAEISLVTYEGKGPHGVMMIVECATDNPTRTVANVKVKFAKNGGQLAQSGSLSFLFSRKAVFEVQKSADIDAESLELTLIDAGLDELQADDQTLYLYAPYTEFGAISRALEELGIEPNAANLQYLPNSPQEFSDEAIAEIDILIDKLEEDDDVQAVYTNIA
ncbi:putative transcriptional regulatory protein [Campylobacterota bacterium]|nr:putative transcriptional regulatory protein [Campylobacterota bacterium]GHV05412.1 putative transcriptional regulatory protein [Campylobacterota bacterium]